MKVRPSSTAEACAPPPEDEAWRQELCENFARMGDACNPRAKFYRWDTAGNQTSYGVMHRIAQNRCRLLGYCAQCLLHHDECGHVDVGRGPQALEDSQCTAVLGMQQFQERYRQLSFAPIWGMVEQTWQPKQPAKHQVPVWPAWLGPAP